MRLLNFMQYLFTWPGALFNAQDIFVWRILITQNQSSPSTKFCAANFIRFLSYVIWWSEAIIACSSEGWVFFLELIVCFPVYCQPDGLDLLFFNAEHIKFVSGVFWQCLMVIIRSSDCFLTIARRHLKLKVTKTGKYFVLWPKFSTSRFHPSFNQKILN